METISLKEKEVFPSAEVLKNVLGASYPAYEALVKELAAMDITPEWNYYRDGNAWLCKMPCKKKNLGWIATYDGYFSITCYFMEKHFEGIAQLDIADSIKEAFYQTKPSGKLIPMNIRINSGELPEDVMRMLVFKKSLC